MLDEVVLGVLVDGFPRLHSLETFASPGLGPEFDRGGPLDVATVRNGDDVRVVRDQVDHGDVALVHAEVGLARGRVAFLDVEKLVFDDLEDTLFAGEDVEKVFYLLEELVVLVFHLVALKSDELV